MCSCKAELATAWDLMIPDVTLSSTPLLPLAFPRLGGDMELGQWRILIVFFLYLGKKIYQVHGRGTCGSRGRPWVSAAPLPFVCTDFTTPGKSEIHLGTADLCPECSHRTIAVMILGVPFLVTVECGFKIMPTCVDLTLQYLLWCPKGPVPAVLSAHLALPG